MAEAAAMEPAARRGILPDAPVEAPDVALSILPPVYRVSLRARPDAVDALNRALSIGLPTRPKTSAREGSLAALWLGPDEWLLLDGERDPNLSLRGLDALHSAVDISHRNVALQVSGRHAADAISGGCPQNLLPETFPVGACSRTVLGKAEIVLWRTDEETFRVECWRSFAPYVHTFLATAMRDAAA
jgi:sarcosine oxidase, subunit gamma